MNSIYSSFLSSKTAAQWKKIGLSKRAGVCTPLFSLYSKKSIGSAEFRDLKLLVDWCRKTGMSIIQLLPMNDVGFNFRPYDAQSSYALEPMYLSLDEIRGIRLGPFRKDTQRLRENFPAGRGRIRYGVKSEKLSLLQEMFKTFSAGKSGPFQQFFNQNLFWLKDDALFKVLQEEYRGRSWENWPEEFKHCDPDSLQYFETIHADRIRFHQWLQWQCFEQFHDAKKYAQRKKVLLMGDLPFLVARDSADVWAHQDYFKLDLVSGAPPDAFFARGQRWGMPPYHWDQIAADDYNYLRQKIKYASHFYDFFRIDHVVGAFRLWTIPAGEPLENAGLNGSFDPPDEKKWEEHGKKLLSVMIESSNMLPCAEDLGVVPACSYKTLEEFAIPGMEVQRWTKEWEGDCSFKAPERYRKNAMAVISNHDMTSFGGWWEYEAGTEDGELFERKCREKAIAFEAIRDRLFDLSGSAHGRLRWRNEVGGMDPFLSILGRSEQEAGELAGFYRDSFAEKQRFWHYLELKGNGEEKSSPDLVRTAIAKIHEAASIFSIQLLQDWLSLDPDWKEDSWEFRINFPGTHSDKNWSLVMPLSLEEMNHLKINAEIKKMNAVAGRI